MNLNNTADFRLPQYAADFVASDIPDIFCSCNSSPCLSLDHFNLSDIIKVQLLLWLSLLLLLLYLARSGSFRSGIVGSTPYSPFFRTAEVLLYVHKINKPTEKGINMTLFIIYLILTPFLCLIGMFSLEYLEKKLKAAVAKKTKAAHVHSCTVEKITYTDTETRKAV